MRYETGSPCECLQELPVFVSICLRFTLQILSARQSTCPLHPEFPAACPLSHIPWSQQPFSPAPKITLFPYRKQAAPAMCCKNCPYLFQFVWVLLCRFCLHGNRLARCIQNFRLLALSSLVTTTFFACSKDNTLSIQKTGSPCDVLQELPVCVSICLRFTLQILPARQSTCPLRSQRPFHLLQRQYATHQYFFHTENGQSLQCVARTARICFNLFAFYFADSVCMAIGLPFSSRISGCLPSVTHSLVTTTFFACSKDGTSYMVCTKMLSMMERRPLAPVFR